MGGLENACPGGTAGMSGEGSRKGQINKVKPGTAGVIRGAIRAVRIIPRPHDRNGNLTQACPVS